MLKLMKIADNDECRYCGDLQVVESIKHLLGECETVARTRFKYLGEYFFEELEEIKGMTCRFKFVDLRKQQLPNILPQFRPNAKIGSGPPPFKDRVNSYPGSFPNRMLPPQYGAQRRTPVVHRYPTNQPPQEANRRIYRGSDKGPNQFVDHRQFFYRRNPQMSSSVKPQQPPLHPPSQPFQGASYAFPGKVIQPYKESEKMPVERNSKHSVDENYPPETNLGSDRLAAFEEEDILVNDPPKPTTITKKSDEPELEPVVTLQMLKTKKLTSVDNPETINKEPPKFDYEVIGPTQGLYVVYPHKTGNSKLQPEEIQVPPEQKPQESPMFNFEGSSQGSDYQNTPFSVVRDVKQEPILMAKPQKPLHQKSHEEFPYRLEKPSIQELGHVHEINHNDNYGAFAEKVAIADTPIAIAYSPTESSPYKNLGQKKNFNGQHQAQFSNPNSASQVIPEIRDENEYETDSRGQNYEKDFQAPFYPSLSLNSATPNGWSYEVTGAPTGVQLDELYKKGNINRSDKGISDNDKETKSPSEKVKLQGDSDSFSPQLQGGFKPIYPPGYKEESLMLDDSLITRAEISPSTPETTTQREVTTSPTTTTSVISTTTTEKPKADKKKEPSLADILFGTVDEDEDLGEIES